MLANRLFAATVLAVVASAAPALADPVKVVAAENFYGDIAAQIGGANVAVTSILTNPDQDPHLFEASAETAKALTDAKIVIVNGVDYDPWMEKLLSRQQGAGPQGNRRRRAGRPQGRRQSASLVRAGLREGRRQGADARISSPSTPRTRPTMRRARRIPRLAEAAGRQARRNAQEICRLARHGLRAGVRLCRGPDRPEGPQREIRARGHEQRRAHRVRRRRLRERPQGPQGQGDALQRAGERAGGAAPRADGEGQQNPRRRRHRDRAAGRRLIRAGCSANSTRSTRRSAARPIERTRVRQGDRSGSAAAPFSRPPVSSSRTASSSACSAPTAPARRR